MSHHKKVLLKHFAPIFEGVKTFEISSDEGSDIKVGDLLKLTEVEEDGKTATGRTTVVRVTHKLTSSDYPEGLKNGYSVLSFEVII